MIFRPAAKAKKKGAASGSPFRLAQLFSSVMPSMRREKDGAEIYSDS